MGEGCRVALLSHERLSCRWEKLFPLTAHTASHPLPALSLPDKKLGGLFSKSSSQQDVFSISRHSDGNDQHDHGHAGGDGAVRLNGGGSGQPAGWDASTRRDTVRLPTAGGRNVRSLVDGRLADSVASGDSGAERKVLDDGESDASSLAPLEKMLLAAVTEGSFDELAECPNGAF